MRVLITGSSGHVGGAIARHFLERGFEVVGLSQSPSRLGGQAQEIQADIGSDAFAERVAAAVAPCAAIVHAAAALDKDLLAPALGRANCLGMQQVLQLAFKWNVASFVYISGVTVIGTPRSLPVTEEHPIDPPTAYHASKLYGEHLTELARRAGLSAAVLRLTAPVGPGMRSDRILSVFVRHTLAGTPITVAGQGSRRQNYVDVRDVASAVESCVRMRTTALCNIAGRHSISNLELARACKRVLGSSSPIQFSGRPDPEEGVQWEVSIARAAACLGYEPRHTIDDSIRTVAAEVFKEESAKELPQAIRPLSA